MTGLAHEGLEPLRLAEGSVDGMPQRSGRIAGIMKFQGDSTPTLTTSIRVRLPLLYPPIEQRGSREWAGLRSTLP